jgi:hypothetical protein
LFGIIDAEALLLKHITLENSLYQGSFPDVNIEMFNEGVIDFYCYRIKKRDQLFANIIFMKRQNRYAAGRFLLRFLKNNILCSLEHLIIIYAQI